VAAPSAARKRFSGWETGRAAERLSKSLAAALRGR